MTVIYASRADAKEVAEVLDEVREPLTALSSRLTAVCAGMSPGFGWTGDAARFELKFAIERINAAWRNCGEAAAVIDAACGTPVAS